MKKLQISATLLLMAFCSCRKDYTCTCTAETRQQNHSYSTSTYTATYSNVTRSQAKKQCKEEEVNSISSYIHDCSL